MVRSRKFRGPPAIPLDLEVVLVAFGASPVRIRPGIGSALVFPRPYAGSTPPENNICACDVCTFASLNVLTLMGGSTGMGAFNSAAS